MAIDGHAFWPSFPSLETTLSVINDGLWRFGPISFGALEDC